MSASTQERVGDRGPAIEQGISIRSMERSFRYVGVRHVGGQTFVLRNLDFDIHDGEFFSIMGPSGAGTSTLLHILGMYDTAYGDEYWMWETPVHNLERKERADLQRTTIGFVFQSYHLIDDLTIYENLDVPLYRDIRKRSAMRSCATRWTGSRSS